MSTFNLKVWSATLSSSAAAAYALCVVFRPLFPDWAMYNSEFWVAMFPGFSWSIAGILIGLLESAIYGLLAALIFVPLYNFFIARFVRS